MTKAIGSRTITVIRGARTDWLGGSAATESRHDITGCAVLPRTSFESERGWVVVDGRQVVAPYDSDITADDKIDVDGQVWDVDGAPGNYEKRNGVGKAMIVYLKSVS